MDTTYGHGLKRGIISCARGRSSGWSVPKEQLYKNREEGGKAVLDGRLESTLLIQESSLGHLSASTAAAAASVETNVLSFQVIEDNSVGTLWNSQGISSNLT